MWVDPNLNDFYSRVSRIEKSHAKGYGFEAAGTLGRKGSSRTGSRLLKVAKPLVLALAVGVFLAVQRLLNSRFGHALQAIRGYGFRHALIVTDAGLARAGVAAKVAALLQAQDIEATIFSGAQPNPTVANVEAGLALLRDKRCDCVISLDCDALDSSEMPAVAYPSPGGLTYTQVTDLIAGVAAKARIAGFCMVEFIHYDVVESLERRGLGVEQQADHPFDVVGVDVRDHQQVEMARAGGQVQDRPALRQAGGG